MKNKKEIIVLGDIEIGAGTLTDDFISDKALSELILKLSNKKHSVDLILNGDTFDFLKCPLIVNQTTTYPRHITPEISVAKLELMYKAHRKVFDALDVFTRKSKNNLYFIVGNHDYDLVYKQVRKKIREYLGNKKNIYFKFYYEKYQVYVEHGHQYDILNKINYELMFIKYKGKTILNMPWLAFGLVGKYMHIKEQYPLMERIFPRPRLFSLNRNIAKMLTRYSLKYLFLSVFYYPIRYFFDPTYGFPKGLLSNLFRKIKTFKWVPDDVAELFQADKIYKFKKNKIFVLSHNHRYKIKQRKRYTLIQLDCWRDEYFITSKGRLIPKEKYYAQIFVNGKDLDWKVLQYPIKRSSFKFKSVAKNEIKYINKAAKEECYKFNC